MAADTWGGHPAPDRRNQASDLNPRLERLTDLERRSLLAEQVRQQAHRLRTPLSVINLVAETLQLQAQSDEGRAERLARIQGAAGSLANELSVAVNAVRFGDGPRQRLDPTRLAAEVVSTFGGQVVTATAASAKTTMAVEPASLEAALVHAMRLVGVGTDCNGICAQRPMLEVQRNNGDLLLVVSAQGSQPADTPRERVDLRLMAQAAERAANDHCGRLTLGPDKVTFRLPLGGDGCNGIEC
mgnify:CR=1 FL=1